MAKGKHPYHEKLLHWIWQHRHFPQKGLQSTIKKPIEIHDPGRLNITDGPDFTGAVISIGNLKWHGDVELHWKLSDWYAHRHQLDGNYENVILHVVFAETDRMISRSDKSSIPTLCLSSYLPQPLQSFLSQYRQQPQLPCAGGMSFISEEAFVSQLDKAHKEYFEQKVDDLLQFYDSNLPLSEAWKKMMAIALFDGLGISHNREPMRKLAAYLYGELPSCSNSMDLTEKALAASGIHSNEQSRTFNWKHKGCRPGNHPLGRIRQGADCLWHIHRLPFQHWHRNSPDNLWRNLRNSVSTKPSLGRERSSILFATVFLPALYLLGNLLHSKKIKNQTWTLWQNHRAILPPSLLRLLKKTGLPPHIYSQKLGAVYQLRAYCRPNNCQDCEVFKKTISS